MVHWNTEPDLRFDIPTLVYKIVEEGAFMKTLPDHFSVYRSTPEFDADSVPKGLLKAHHTKAGTWGKIVILKGRLKYRILPTDENEMEENILSPQCFGVVEPTVLHEVEVIDESVRFRVDFLKEDD